MTETVKTVIDDALSLLGVLGQGETPTSGEYQKALRLLNNMMANWSVTSKVPNRVEREFQMVAGKTDYGVGDGEDWDTGDTPINVYAASRVVGGSGRMPNTRKRDPGESLYRLRQAGADEFSDEESFGLPESYWYKRWDDDGGNAPGGRIYFDGESNDWIRLFLEMPFGTWGPQVPDDLSTWNPDAIKLPPEFFEPMKYHLALRCVTPFYADLTKANASLLSAIAGGSKDIVDSINVVVPQTDLDILNVSGVRVNIDGPLF